jgi:hypothetical protein
VPPGPGPQTRTGVRIGPRRPQPVSSHDMPQAHGLMKASEWLGRLIEPQGASSDPASAHRTAAFQAHTAAHRPRPATRRTGARRTWWTHARCGASARAAASSTAAPWAVHRPCTPVHPIRADKALDTLEGMEDPAVDLRRHSAYRIPVQVITQLMGVPEGEMGDQPTTVHRQHLQHCPQRARRCRQAKGTGTAGMVLPVGERAVHGRRTPVCRFARQAHLVDAATSSAATLAPYEGGWQVRESGPVTLWEPVEPVLDACALGCPACHCPALGGARMPGRRAGRATVPARRPGTFTEATRTRCSGRPVLHGVQSLAGLPSS